jgi:hypothetical protein
MRHAWLIALAIVAGAGGVVYALLILSGELRHVSDELDVVARDLSSMTDDVRSLADDVKALADALTGEEDTEEPESPIAVDVAGGQPARGGAARTEHASSSQALAGARIRKARSVARRPREAVSRPRWVSSRPPAR